MGGVLIALPIASAPSRGRERTGPRHLRPPHQDSDRRAGDASRQRHLSDLPTPRDYAGVHRVDAVCTACDHWAMLDLEDLVRRGFGDVPLIRLPLRCAGCGKRGHKVVASGRSYPVQRP